MNKHKKQFYLLAFSLLASFSSFHFEKTLGFVGLLAYPIVVYLIMSLFYNKKLLFTKAIDKYNPFALFFLFMILLFLFYSFWYPYEDIRSRGSDRDEALNQAVEEIISLKYPYYVRTVVKGRAHELGLDGNPITVLPGSILFALPFVLIGNSTYQNFFWLIILFFFFAKYYKSYSYSLIAIILNIFLCGTFLFQILIGSDYIANSIWVLILTVLFIDSSFEFTKKSAFISALFGIGLASRFNFIMVLPPLLIYFIMNRDTKNTIKHFGVVLLSYSLMILPFLLYDYYNFTPLHSSNFFSWYNNMIPYSSIIFPTVTLLLSIILPLLLKANYDNILLIISYVLLFPVVLFVILDSISKGRVSFEYTHYAFTSFIFISFITFNEFKINKRI